MAAIPSQRAVMDRSSEGFLSVLTVGTRQRARGDSFKLALALCEHSSPHIRGLICRDTKLLNK